METSSCQTLLFSSSATVYGRAESPLREESPTGIDIASPYGKTKQVIEELLRDYAYANSQLTLVLLRYFNPVGAHPSGLIGEAPVGIPNNLFPLLSGVAFAAQSPQLTPVVPLSIFGNDYPTPDGTCIRDFIHVCDLAEAHLAALKAPTGLHVYNVGTGTGSSVYEVVKAYQEYNRIKIPFRFAPRRPGDCAATFCSAEKIRRSLGWQPKRVLADMVRDSWRWTLRYHSLELAKAGKDGGIEVD